MEECNIFHYRIDTVVKEFQLSLIYLIRYSVWSLNRLEISYY